MPRRFAASMMTVAGLIVCAAVAPASAADVRIGVNIGPPPVVIAPPAPVVVARPAPVVVAPPVVIAPGAPLYYYGASYYTFYNGAWFVGPAYGGPWAYVPAARVPRAIVAVPRAYHRIPSGHGGRHFAGPAPWAHGHRH
jgi:hypothetical protein